MNALNRLGRRHRHGAAAAVLLAVLMIWHPAAHAQDASQPYLGQIFAVAFDFAPKGFASCNGQLLPINQNQALFALLGTTYGGDGRTTFALPDLRGRVAMNADPMIALGEKGGEEAHTLTVSEMPAHMHQLNVSSGIGSSPYPHGGVIARDAGGAVRYGPNASVIMAPGAIVSTGGSQPHENRMPFVVVHYIIALQGIFPSRP